MAPPKNIFQFLEAAAENEWEHGIFIDLPAGLEREVTENSKYDGSIKDEDGYSSEENASNKHPTGWISYRTLLRNVRAESPIIQSLMAMHKTEIVLIYTDNDLDGIHWFWTVVCAGGIPCICPKLQENLLQRTKQIMNLKETLDNPLILTTSNLEPQFQVVDGLKLWTVNKIEKGRRRILPHRPLPSDVTGTGEFYDFNGLSIYYQGHKKKLSDLALLMLTSGSTGNSKAVCLTNANIIASVKGKNALHGTTSHDVFLNCKSTFFHNHKYKFTLCTLMSYHSWNITRSLLHIEKWQN